MKNPLYLLLFYLAGIVVSCGSKKESTTVKESNITELVYASGSVKSKNQYQVCSKSNGTIIKFFVTEGDNVKIGDLIAKIENSTIELTKENLNAAANFNLQKNNADKLDELEATIGFAKLKYINDSTLYYKQKNLWSQGIGSKLELDQKELAAKNSYTQYKTALLKYSQLKKQISFLDKQANINYTIASKQAQDLDIRSEVNGKVFSILKKQGEYVNSINPIAIIGDTNNYYLELFIDEYDIKKIKINQEVFITMDSYKGNIFKARVTKIYPGMNERTRTFTLEAMFTQEPPKLYPNLTLEANIVIQTKSNVLLLPRQYIIDDEYVLTSDGKKKKIKLGLKDYQKAEIIDGLVKGEEVIKPQ